MAAVVDDFIAKNTQVTDFGEHDAAIRNQPFHRFTHRRNVTAHAASDDVVENVQIMHADEIAAIHDVKKPDDADAIGSHIGDAISCNFDIIQIPCRDKFGRTPIRIILVGCIDRFAWITGIGLFRIIRYVPAITAHFGQAA